MDWVIKIRKGMKFHDLKYGEVKAEDVIASLTWLLQEGWPRAAQTARRDRRNEADSAG